MQLVGACPWACCCTTVPAVDPDLSPCAHAAYPAAHSPVGRLAWLIASIDAAGTDGPRGAPRSGTGLDKGRGAAGRGAVCSQSEGQRADQ